MEEGEGGEIYISQVIGLKRHTHRMASEFKWLCNNNKDGLNLDLFLFFFYTCSQEQELFNTISASLLAQAVQARREGVAHPTAPTHTPISFREPPEM